ncbi:TRAP transporter small permease [Ruania zhangjianzhongii]|uniref:TRAP transporter small permease n=1 Tax=Ruania zhangjianzhongii TaxID=2603206 RepID=UPI0011CA64D9|nr:TRAP transporter small permease [Ruania zhangjianzhongii]
MDVSAPRDFVLKRLLKGFEDVVLAGTFIVMILAMAIQVLNRTFWQFSMPWLEETSLFAMLYMVLIGTEAGLRDGSQIAVTMLPDKLRGRARLAVQLLAKVAVLVFSVVMLIGSYNLVQQQVTSGQTSPALGWPMWVPYGSFAISFLLIVVVQAIALVLQVRALIANDESIAMRIDVRTQDNAEPLTGADGDGPDAPIEERGGDQR